MHSRIVGHDIFQRIVRRDTYARTHVRDRTHAGEICITGIPVSRIDPRCFSCVVINEVHFSIEVLRDVPPFRKRYLPIPSPWHISLRSKSIQNSLSPTSRQAYTAVRAGTHYPRYVHAVST